MTGTATVPLSEQALVFHCGGESLLGVLSPAAVASEVGVVIIVGGPQYRAGAHRQFVALARALAAAGTPVLRFDYRGMGDSSGALRDFEQAGADIDAAVTALQSARPEVRRVVLWGLCDGAAAALLYLHDRTDPRVAGLALLNPWVRSQASLAKTHVKHYYLQRLREREFWLKLASGQVAVSAVTGLLANLRAAFGSRRGAQSGAQAPFQTRMARAWSAYAGPVLLMLSEHDYTAREFCEFTAADAEWQRALQRHEPTRVQVEGADHTCSQPGAQRAVESATASWLARTVAAR
jgi:uncharacterized protein